MQKLPEATFSQLTDLFKDQIDKKMHKLAVQFDRKVRDLRPELYDEVCQFLVNQTQIVTKLFTNTHHSLIQQFIEFKERTRHILKEREFHLEQVAMLETALASKSPMLEAENAIDESTALKMYDCLVPHIKEHRRFKILPDSLFSISDFNAMYKVKKLEATIQKEETPKIKEENAKLKVQVIHLENELSVV